MPDQSKAVAITDLSQRPAEPGFWQRTRQAARYIFSGEIGSEWFSPLRPLPSIVPPGQQESVEGRQFDFQVGENLRYIPRANEAVSFWTMRQLAQWDLLAIIINSRKDQLAKLEWTIEPRDKAKRKVQANLCEDVQNWWRSPDQRHTWREWLTMLLDDLLVIDAPCLFVNVDRTGRLWGFEPVDGATIKPLIDAHGRRPIPPDFGYSQALHGTPAMLYTTDQMMYKPRVLRTHKIYGYSPVERIVITVNTALRRQVQQLDHFTEGTMPEAYVGVPVGDKGWTPKQLEEFSQRWNSRLSGNLAERARIQFGPDGANFHEFKKVDLKDEFDEWLARVACAAYGIDPTPFIKQVNRGTQETTREAALSEGLAPYQVWIKELIDECLMRQGFANLQFNWRDDDAVDPTEKANISKVMVAMGAMHPNEVRAEDGLDELPEETIAWLMAMQKSQVVVPPPSEWVDGQPPPAPAPAALPEDPARPTAGASGAAATGAADPGTQAQDESKAEPKPQAAAGKGAAGGALGKASAPAPINRDRRVVKEASERIKRALTKAFRKMAPIVSAQLAELLPNRTKAAGDQPPLDQVLSALQLAELQSLPKYLGTELGDVATDGVKQGVKQVGVSINLDSPNDDAVDWAKARGAELVGMTFDDDGNLIDNPNADMAITDGTREHLRSLVAQAEYEGWSNNRLTQELRDSYAFSASRAEVIARTETARADVQGNLIGWKASGVVESKEWSVGEGCCDECQDLDGVVVGIDEQFPNDGGDGPPLHPQCFSGDAVVAAHGISTYLKRWFEGEVVVIGVSGQADLTVTPNHPILTQRGWVAAGALQLTDQLFKSANPRAALAGRDPDHDYVEARFDEVFRAALMAGRVPASAVPVSAEDFHGDGVIDTYVHVVRADRLLYLDGAKRHKDSPHRSLRHAEAVEPEVCFSLDGGGAESVEVLGFSAASGVSRTGHGGALLRGGVCPSNDHAAANVARLQTHPLPAIAKRAAVAADAPAYLHARLASHVSPVQIQSLVIAEFRGHVFNIETSEGWYFANGIIAHNCRCDVSPVIKETADQAEEETA
jgi:hypothetical protein